MLSSQEIYRSLVGSWMLVKGRRDGMAAFDVSIGGFWRSFGAALVILPIYAATMVAQRHVLISDTQLGASDFPDNAFFIGNLIGFFVDWVAFPILMAFLARPLGIAERFVPFIVARNWSSVIAILPYSIPILLYAAGIINADLTTLLTLAAIFFVLYYRYTVTRISLDCSISLSIGLVVLDLVLSLVLGEVINRLIGLTA